MTQKNVWVNEDGIEVGFGPVVSFNTEANTQHTKGKVKQIEIDVDVAAGLPSVGTAHTAKDFAIPAGAQIISAYYRADVDFDNAVEFGTSQKDGTAIDQDGLIATGTTTAVGAGALIGTVTSEANYLVVTATTTAPTVGSGELVVEYIL
jgi:hypothetical protein